MITCPNCGNQAAEGAVFCDQCGTRLPAPQPAAPPTASAPTGGSVICPSCNAPNVPGEAFCDYCGAPLEAPEPVVETAPALEPVSAEAGVQAPPAAAGPAAVEAAPAEAKPTCPACGAEVLPGEAFCAACGASLAQPPIPPEPVPEVEAEPVPAPAPPQPLQPVAEAEPVVGEAPPAPVVVEAPPPPLPTPVPAPAPTCPACGTAVEAGDSFCSSCGALLTAAPAPVAAPAVEAPPPPPPMAGPRLVVAASGAEIPLPPVAEILIGREDPVSGIFPEVELTPHGGEEGGVSRRHARLIVEGGNYFIEDLDSTNFTFVNKQKVTPKARQPLKNGDEIRCGRVTLILQY
jgi:predicted amidophosphoribosyltransferase